MLFYSDYNSPRLTYILDLISSEIFNEPFTLVSDKEAFKSYVATKLNYSDAAAYPRTNFIVHPHGLLFETGIWELHINRVGYFR